MIRRWLLAILAYFRRPPSVLPREVSASVAEEVRFHIDEATQENVAAGMPEFAARRAAVARFGDAGKVAAECYSIASSDQILFHRLHLVLTGALLIGIALFWAAQPAAESDPADPPALTIAGDAGARSDGRAGLTGDVSGQVMNETAEPIPGAHILAVVKTWPPNGYRQQAYMTTSGPDGRFRIADVYPVGQEYEVQIATVADRRVLESTYISSSGDALEPIVFRLEPTHPVALRIVRGDGGAIEGAEVFPYRRIDSSGNDHLVYFQSADPIIRRTNRSGNVELPCYRPGDRATVYVRLPDDEWQTREITVPHGRETVLLNIDASPEEGRS